MFRKLFLVIAILIPLLAFNQGPGSDIAGSSVVYIKVGKKQSNGKLKWTHGTGWAWKEKTWVVTALHVVAKADRIKVSRANRESLNSNAKIIKIYKKGDLALIELDNDIGLTPLATKSVNANSTASFLLWGYPQSLKKINGKKIQFSYSLDKEPKLSSLLSGSKFIKALNDQGYPSTDVKIYQVESTITKGHSGAPIIDNGSVIGIANGGLRNGVEGLNWAIPSSYLPYLVTYDNQRDQFQSQTQVQDILFSGGVETPADASEELVDMYLEREEESSTIRGGNGNEIHRTWTASLSDIFYTMDEEDKNTVNELLNQEYISVNDTFDVYEDYDTGMTYALPSGYKVVYEDGLYRVIGNEFIFAFTAVSGIPFNQAEFQLDSFINAILQQYPGARRSVNFEDSRELDINNKTLDKVVFREVFYEGKQYLLSIGGSVEDSDVGFVYIDSRLPREMNYDQLREFLLFSLAMELFSLP